MTATDAGGGETIQTPASRRASKMLEPAILLLLLEREGTHGYELRERIDELDLTDAEIDSSAVYRCLRWLEQHDQVRSSWDTAGGGPAKRRYALTELGIKTLTLWADQIKRRRSALDRYLDRYRRSIGIARRRQRI